MRNASQWDKPTEGSKLTALTHPDGFTANYAYNAGGELTGITDSASNVLARFDYDSVGRRSQLNRGPVGGAGATTTYAYDAQSRLSTLTQDLAGTSQDSVTTFSYTPASQMASRTLDNDAVYSWRGHYNATFNYQHNGLNQVTQAATAAVSHDANGNITAADSAWTYAYDSENKLRSASNGSQTAQINYDPLGMVRRVEVPGVTAIDYLYDGGDLVAEYNGSGTLRRRYVHGDGADEPLVWYEGSGTTDRRWLHADERGSIVAVSNSAGISLATYSYSPYGEPNVTTGSRFKYTGQVYLETVPLYYYKSRFYSPKLGRFLQPDPVGYEAGMNLYAYVGGDPVNRRDPTGLMDEIVVTGHRPAFSAVDIFGGMHVVMGSLDLSTTFGDPFHRENLEDASAKAQKEKCPSIYVCQPPPEMTVCKGPANFTAVGGSQARADGALYSKYDKYSIKGGTNGTVAVQTGFLGFNRAQLRQYGTQITVSPSDGGLIAATGGPSGPLTVSDFGDVNVQNWPGVAFDVYRWPSITSALKFGRRDFDTTISFPKASGGSCPTSPGWGQK